MGIILLIIFLKLCFWAGWLLTTRLEVRSKFEKVSSSFLLGLWMATFGMFVGYQVTGYFSAELTLGAAVILNIFLWMILGSGRQKRVITEITGFKTNLKSVVTTTIRKLQTITRFESLLLLIVLAVAVMTLAINLLTPINDWDAIALYDFRAVVIDQVGTWEVGTKLGYFYQYPPFTSLLHAASYLMGFDRAKVVYSLLFAGFLILFYGLLRRHVSRTQALIGVFLLSLAPLFSSHITIAYTNLPFTIFFSAGMIYLWNWLLQKQESDMKLALLFTAAASWVRVSEPFWVIILAVIFLGRLFIVKNVSWKTVIGYSVVYLGLVHYWSTYVGTLDIPPPPEFANIAGKLIDEVTPVTIIEHLLSVSTHFYLHAIKPLWSLLLPIVVMVIGDQAFRNSQQFRITLVTLGLILSSVFAGTYYFSFYYEGWNLIGDSLTRLMICVVPLLVYIITLSSLWPVIFKHLASWPSREAAP